MFTACISNIVLWFVLHVSGQYWPFAFTSNKTAELRIMQFSLKGIPMSQLFAAKFDDEIRRGPLDQGSN